MKRDRSPGEGLPGNSQQPTPDAAMSWEFEPGRFSNIQAVNHVKQPISCQGDARRQLLCVRGFGAEEQDDF